MRILSRLNVLECLHWWHCHMTAMRLKYFMMQTANEYSYVLQLQEVSVCIFLVLFDRNITKIARIFFEELKDNLSFTSIKVYVPIQKHPLKIFVGHLFGL